MILKLKNTSFTKHKSPILINNINISEISVSKRFLLVNKILNISLVTKMLKNRPLHILLPKMSIYIKNLVKLDVCTF